jgi:hypothetical protein
LNRAHHELTDTRRPIGSGVWIAVCACKFETPGEKKRKAAIRLIEGHIRKEANRPDSCPHPRKQRFLRQETAVANLGRRWRHIHPGQLIAHTYLCRCGYWHLTKRDQTP